MTKWKDFKSSFGIFLFELFLSIRLNSVILFYIKFGTKHATWEHDYFYGVDFYQSFGLSYQAK